MSVTIAPYHLLGLTERTRAFSKWRPAIAIGVVLVGFAVLQVVWVLGAVGVLGFDWLETFVMDGTEDAPDSDPRTMLLTYGAIAITAPIAFLAAWASGRKARYVLSVEGRWRWRKFGPALAIVGGPVVVLFIADLAMFGEVPAGADRTFWLCALVAATVIPVQCLAEELIFRGSLTQSIGAWTANPWIAYLAPVPLFVIGHPYDAAGMVSVGMFALAASYLVHRTGGIESATAVHVVNNVSISYAMFSGIAEEDGPRYWLYAATDLAMVGAVVLLLAMSSGAKVARVYTTNAHILHLPHPAGDLLFQSQLGSTHAGVPVVAPWFAQTLGPEMHGWARNSVWTVAEGSDTARLTRDGLTLAFTARGGVFELRATNDASEPRLIQLAFHPYWRVDAVQARAIGLSGSEVFDKVTGSSGVVSGDLGFGSEVDAVVRSQGPVLLDDGNRWIRIETSGTDHTVVWNPGPEACADAPDLGDEEWREFVCVEPALLGADRGGVSLAPGESAGISMRVTAGPVPEGHLVQRTGE